MSGRLWFDYDFDAIEGMIDMVVRGDRLWPGILSQLFFEEALPRHIEEYPARGDGEPEPGKAQEFFARIREWADAVLSVAGPLISGSRLPDDWPHVVKAYEAFLTQQEEYKRKMKAKSLS